MAKKKGGLRSLIPRPVKRVILGARYLYHRATSPIRVLPDYICIGTQKGGTSSFFYNLAQHPCVGRAFYKEVDFFDNNFQKGLGWYRTFFPTVLTKWYHTRLRGRRFVTGEASTYYMMHPLAAKRAASVLPHLKVIVFLRNPIDRAYSHWNRYHISGMEPLSLEEAIDKEPERLKGEFEKLLADETYFSYNHWHYGYLERGLYVKQVPAWMEAFPREQIRVYASEDYRDRPAEILADALKFLGLPPMTSPPREEHNVGGYRETMDPRTRARLVEFFRPYNARLYDYLGRRFDWDK